MPKRFTATELWNEDWFLALTPIQRLLWFYIKDHCDHAGIWKPNVIAFNRSHHSCVVLSRCLSKFNSGKERIIVLSNGRWFLSGFVEFQYGKQLNPNSHVHLSILGVLHSNGIDLEKYVGQGQVEVILRSLRPHFEVNERSTRPQRSLKDKDMDKDKDKSLLVKGNVRTEPAPCERCGHSVSAKEWNEGHEEKCKRKNPLSHVPGNVQAVIK